MLSIAFILIAFGCGSLPFSVWLGKGLLGVDVRRFGDGNPGAANVFRAGSRWAALIALLLDVSKAAAPVGLAYFNLGLRGLPMLLIAIAPILGHAFSPFLHFKGGKALASALGVWIGLTLWKVSLPAALGAAAGIALFTASGWAVMLALAVILAALLLGQPDPLLIGVWACEVVILAWTHRADLMHPPKVRPWLAQHLGRRKDQA